MNNFLVIEDMVLRRVTPTPEDYKEIADIVEELKKRLYEEAKKQNINLTIHHLGSTARDTFLKGDKDIDIFMLFDKSLSKKELESVGLKIAESVLNGEHRYAEHPYLHAIYKNYEVDIVPAYKIESPVEKISAVDRTIFHQQFLIKHFNDENKKQIRLLKQFLKGIGLYGAEIAVGGFSGYLTELLLLKFGTFQNVIHEVSSWNKHMKLTLTDFPNIEFNAPLVFIDPTDMCRNVAAAVTEQAYSLFIHACREFIKNPSLNFFFPPQRQHIIENPKVVIEKRGTHLFGVIIPVEPIPEDILYSQAKKTTDSITNILEKYGFPVLKSRFSLNKERLLIILEIAIHHLAAIEKHYGPPVWNLNSKKFLEKWSAHPRKVSIYIENGKWLAILHRKFRTPEESVKELLPQLSTGKNIREYIKRKFEVVDVDYLLKNGYERELNNFFDDRFPWEA